MDALLRDLRTAPAPALMAVSGAGFISLAASPPATPGLSLCGSLSSVTLADLSPLVMDGRTLGILAVAWLAMVLAMMPLLALQQVRHAMRSSVARRRRLAALLLLTGYALVWMVVGLAMVPLAAFLHAAAHPALILPCIAVALLWSSSPAGGRAHNACHRLYPVAASGPRRTGTAWSTGCAPARPAPRPAGHGCWRPSPSPQHGICRSWRLPPCCSSWSAPARRCGPPGGRPMCCDGCCTASRAIC